MVSTWAIILFPIYAIAGYVAVCSTTPADDILLHLVSIYVC